MVKQAVRELVEAGQLDQLVIYFAGHGVNRNYGEYWLLSDAPSDTQAAVNMAGSARLAAHCGIPHVVLISDACRTAPEGIGAQHVRGSEIFPNTGGGGPERPVDEFFACSLGYAAHEVEDPVTRSKQYTAVYTAALLEALHGRRLDVLEYGHDGSSSYVRPRPLKRYLHHEVSRRLKDLGLSTRFVQVPDARIVSDERAWVARFAGGQQPPAGPLPAGPRPVEPRPRTSVSLANELVEQALRAHPGWRDRTLHADSDATMLGARERARLPSRNAEPSDALTPDECAFRVRGGRLTQATCITAEAELVGANLVRLRGLAAPGCSVLLVLNGTHGVALPAIPGFIAELTMEGHALVDVAYVASGSSSHPSKDPRHGAGRVRALRALASAATRNGTFRLEGAVAIEFSRALVRGVRPDLALAIYGAYAYQYPRRGELLAALVRRLRVDLGALPCHRWVSGIENKTDVRNPTANRHGISGYLDDAEVARRIHDALLAP